jgi:transcriptional regulator with XRE-family HTH domain
MTKSLYTERHARLCGLLIEARKKRGLTQHQVAKALGRPQSFVAKYEVGERRLDLLEFLEVADALRVDPSQFIKQLKH